VKNKEMLILAKNLLMKNICYSNIRSCMMCLNYDPSDKTGFVNEHLHGRCLKGKFRPGDDEGRF
jgi:hypothetical protein